MGFCDCSATGVAPGLPLSRNQETIASFISSNDNTFHKTTVEYTARAYIDNIVWEDVYHSYFPKNR